MKTSPTQFDIMVTYMEQHGDLLKPPKDYRDKIECLKRWNSLTSILNSDASGHSKPIEKWKKVWTDFKNNTKKKVARIHRAAHGNGSWPALRAKLTDLEKRMLMIIGTQPTTGIEDVHKTGSPQISQDDDEDPIARSSPVVVVYASELPVQVVKEEENWDQPGPSSPMSMPPEPSPRPDATGQTRPVQRQTSPRLLAASPRRLRRPLRRVHRASQGFLRSDNEWRHFQIEMHRQQDANEKERLRLREIELQLQQQWQEIMAKMIDVLDKIVKKNL